MAFRDLLLRMRHWFAGEKSEETRRRDGGTSHYRPLGRKAVREEGPQAVAPGQEPPAPAYVHTGFTGMNPPSGRSWDGGATFGGGVPGSEPSSGIPGAFARQESRWLTREDNISYMPGYAPNAPDRGAMHVEHILALTGLKSCYEAIECMKNGETLIVMLDAIANENESVRCQDMLCGAAFTLGCTVRLLSGARMVLIAPPGVVILPEELPRAERIRSSEAEGSLGTEAAGSSPIPRRERRSGVHAAEWQAARGGNLSGYNPYTGAQPVAAGSYGQFGGYGA